MRTSFRKNTITLLIPSIIYSTFYGNSWAQRAVVDVRGCGTGCRVETMQLSKPKRMEDGWGKVLVKETWIEQNYDGVDIVNDRFGGQYWFFANCQEGLVGSGKRSDRGDATISSIYTVDGYRKNVSASGNLYERWKNLCTALGY